MTEAIRQGDIPGVQLRRRLWLEGRSSDEIWPWLTDPRRLASWVGDEVTGSLRDELELRSLVAGETVVETLREAQRESRGDGELDLEHRRSDWRATTRLTFSLTSRPGGCEVSILHQDFQSLPLSTCLTAWEEYRERWAAALARLERALGA